MKKRLSLALLSLAVLSSSACSNLKFPWVYQVKIMQGNFIEQDMVDQLELGMSKNQVRYVLGTPLVEDSFNPDRWDYFYNVRRGDEDFGQWHFTVFFEEGKLARWEGDAEPRRKAENDKDEQDEALEATQKKRDAKF
ncbi:outer membrane protein assembly factor BamE [Agaribacterium haliotis]|uniref:outer membrane protein assembly factor BamE n=1 Tax=Agaribacterium haliotis TaxID=2013869 RepID=UPI000BB55AE0|nr:outer membrane protein assembly factor BamE [Agaribacterium haliotis]